MPWRRSGANVPRGAWRARKGLCRVFSCRRFGWAADMGAAKAVCSSPPEGNNLTTTLNSTFACVAAGISIADGFGRQLHKLAGELSRVVGIEVEFQIVSLAHLYCVPASMFYYDLIARSRQLYGSRHLLE